MLFSLRCREFDLKTNYRKKYENDMKCRICLNEDTIEDEVHTFFQCEVLLHDIQINPDIDIKHLFGNLGQQVRIMKHIMPVITKRNIILNIRSNDQSDS